MLLNQRAVASAVLVKMLGMAFTQRAVEFLEFDGGDDSD